MHAAKKCTDSKCDSFRSITWILEVINGALVYGVVLLDRQNGRKSFGKRDIEHLSQTEKKQKQRNMMRYAAASLNWLVL